MIDTHGVELALPLEVELGEIRRYTIVLPFLPVSKNKFKSWPGVYQSSCRDKWFRHIQAECVRQDLPRGVARIGLAAELQFASYVKRRDPQNYTWMLWWFVPDALVRYGLIDDDYDGKIDFGPSLGIRFGIDRRQVPREKKGLTVLKIVMRVP